MKNKIVITVAILLGVVLSLIVLLRLLTVAGLLIFISPASTLFSLASEKNISGTVVDCETHQPISDVETTVHGNGWGWSESGGLVWDKEYSASDSSNELGDFSINYKLGTAFVARKEGYLTARSFVDDGATVEVGMLKTPLGYDSSDSTYNCKLESECYKTRVEDGVEISWNDCTNPQL
jgi:hypothetical protein